MLFEEHNEVAVAVVSVGCHPGAEDQDHCQPS